MKSPVRKAREGFGYSRLFLRSLLTLILVTFVSLCSITPVFAAPSATPTFSGGDGTKSNPFVITTADQLKELADGVNSSSTSIRSAYNGKHYRLDDDIDLGNYPNWTPIGSSTTYAFNGTFDGNRKKITGLVITGTETYRGLFGYTAECTIKGLGRVSEYQRRQLHRRHCELCRL
jgi:hypothetical protein